MRGRQCPVSVLSCQLRTGREHKAFSGTKKSGKIEMNAGTESYSKRRRQARGERGDAKAVPKAEKKQLARRCVRPIFSFPHAHLKLHTAAGAFAHE